MSGITVQIDASQLRARLAELGRALDTEAILGGIGISAVDWIDRNFDSSGQLGTEGGWPPNSPSTIAAKGSSKPLIDTQRLRQSFDYQVSGNTVRIGTNVEYAPSHEFGVAAGVIRIKSSRNDSGDYKSHPGIPRRKMLPTEEQAKALAVELIDAKIKEVSDG